MMVHGLQKLKWSLDVDRLGNTDGLRLLVSKMGIGNAAMIKGRAVREKCWRASVLSMGRDADICLGRQGEVVLL